MGTWQPCWTRSRVKVKHMKLRRRQKGPEAGSSVLPIVQEFLTGDELRALQYEPVDKDTVLRRGLGGLVQSVRHALHPAKPLNLSDTQLLSKALDTLLNKPLTACEPLVEAILSERGKAQALRRSLLHLQEKYGAQSCLNDFKTIWRGSNKSATMFFILCTFPTRKIVKVWGEPDQQFAWGSMGMRERINLAVQYDQMAGMHVQTVCTLSSWTYTDPETASSVWTTFTEHVYHLVAQQHAQWENNWEAYLECRARAIRTCVLELKDKERALNSMAYDLYAQRAPEVQAAVEGLDRVLTELDGYRDSVSECQTQLQNKAREFSRITDCLEGMDTLNEAQAYLGQAAAMRPQREELVTNLVTFVRNSMVSLDEIREVLGNYSTARAEVAQLLGNNTPALPSEHCTTITEE